MLVQPKLKIIFWAYFFLYFSEIKLSYLSKSSLLYFFIALSLVIPLPTVNIRGDSNKYFFTFAITLKVRKSGNYKDTKQKISYSTEPIQKFKQINW